METDNKQDTEAERSTAKIPLKRLVMLNDNKVVEVCSGCGRASCWYGEFMCEDARCCGTQEMRVGDLRKSPHKESEEYWSYRKMIEIFGEANPFGFKEV